MDNRGLSIISEYSFSAHVIFIISSHLFQCQVKYNSVYDEYDILEEIGVGAFGVVHRAVEKKTGRSFAAKFVPIHHASER